MSISKRLRYTIFRRDGFACVYCGRRAPSVTLEVDHRIPRSLGGPDDPSNLCSACWDCNRGKGPLYFEGRTPEQWEVDGCDSWEEWSALLSDGFEWPDHLPWWMERTRDKSPVVLKFDIYAAAAALAPTEVIYANTIDSVMLRAEAFCDVNLPN